MADEVVGSEALIVDDDDKLAVRIGVALLPGGELLQVTTAVKYKTVRGRLAFEGAHFRYQDAAASERDLLDGDAAVEAMDALDAGQLSLTEAAVLSEFDDDPEAIAKGLDTIIEMRTEEAEKSAE